MRVHILVATTGVLLAGCYSVGDRRITDDSIVSQIVRGTSTQEDVRALIGGPTTVDFTDSGQEKWIYAYAYSQVRGTTFIPYAGAFVGGSDATTHTLTILFRKDGVVENYGRGQASGGGGGLQDVGRGPAQPKDPSGASSSDKTESGE